MDKEYRILGRNIPRVDALLKVTGKATYINDIRLPKMLECKILKSPYAHAKIIKIDTSKAEKVPGVVGILTYKDVPQIPIRAHSSPHHTYRVIPQEVFYVGEQVAAVAAETVEAALNAIELIKVEYEPLPTIFDPMEALKPNAYIMYPDLADNFSPSNFPTETNRGDIVKGFEETEIILESRYSAGVQAHNCLDTHGTICIWEGEDLTIWTSTKYIWAVLDKVCEIMGMPESRVKVIAPYIGGDFGSKAGQIEAMQAVICTIFAKRTGRPVRLQFTREEEIALTHHSVGPLYYYTRGGIKKEDGKPTAMDVVVYFNQGAHNISGLEAPYLGSGAVGLYRFESCRYSAYPAYCNLNMSGSRRGYAEPEGFWCSEQFIDELAESVEMDPVEWRINWAIRQGEPTTTRLVWGELAGGDYKLLLEKGAELFGWKQKWKGWAIPSKIEGPKRRGVGVALGQHLTGVNNEMGVVRVNVDGSVTVFSHAEEVGQGIRTAMCMCVAEVLGVQPEFVKVTEANTEFVPRGFGVFASRGTPLIIGAAVKAAMDAKKQLIERASNILNTKPEDLEIMDGRIFAKSNPDKTVTIQKAATLFGRVGVYGIGYEEVPHYNPETKKPLWEKSNVALFAEVEVDIETGEVRVSKIVSVADAGVVIHPELAKAQLECSIIWGIGYTLYEDLIYDLRHQGRVMNVQMVDYKIPTFFEKTDITAVVISDAAHAPTAPLNMKGLGEGAMVPVAPAIGNAIYNAIGVRIKDIPVTPDKILKALHKI